MVMRFFMGHADRHTNCATLLLFGYLGTCRLAGLNPSPGFTRMSYYIINIYLLARL